jgi:hypothetical protein
MIAGEPWRRCTVGIDEGGETLGRGLRWRARMLAGGEPRSSGDELRWTAQGHGECVRHAYVEESPETNKMAVYGRDDCDAG